MMPETTEDVEFLEFQQELEQESRLQRRPNMMDASLLTTSSSLLATDCSDDNGGNTHDSHHEMDVGIDLNLDTETSSNDESVMDSNGKKTYKHAAATPKTAATTKVDDLNNSTTHSKSRRRSGIPKDISVRDGVEDETTAHQLFLLDQQIVLEQFGVYSDLSGDEEEEVGCLQNAAAMTLEASVNAGARMVSDCHDAGTQKDSEGSSLNGNNSKFCSSVPTACCGEDAQKAYQPYYEGLQLFAKDEDDDRDDTRSKDEEQSIRNRDQRNEKENPEKDTIKQHADDLEEQDYDDGEIEAMIGGNQYAVNRSFSSFSQSGTFCQGNCDVMSQYWERIKLALSNRNGGDYYQAIDAKSQASLFSFFDSAHQQQQLEQKDSLSYSSVGDDGPFSSPFLPVLEKCHSGDASVSNEMDKIISCVLPNGLVFCTVWLYHPDYLTHASALNDFRWNTAEDALAIDESDFYIRNGCEVVWKIAMNDKRFVEFPHHSHATQASDLLRCFSWAGDKDHAVVYHLNQVLSEMRRATEKDCLQEAKENIENQDEDADGIQAEAPTNDSEPKDKEIEVVLWTSHKRIFPHFVDVHANQVSTVHLVREKKSTLAAYSCTSDSAATTSFGRIAFFVKTVDSIPSLMSAPSDEMEETEQGEEAILEESVIDDDGDGDEGEEHLHDDEEHHNEEWSAARSNVTTMIDNRTGPQRVRYVLMGDTDEEFSQKFGL
ncbi:MAG: hypothetical protein SGBAC_009900 [Bacillariaceae sp.]